MRLLAQALRVLEPNGTVVMVGAAGGGRLIGPLGKLARMWLASRRGSRKAVFFVAKFNKPDMETLRELVESGRVRPVVERVYPFAEIGEALRSMGEGHGRAKLVVTF